MHSTDEHHISKGDSEGTPPRARASKTGQSSSADPFFLRGFRARGFPPVPALPSSLLDGKEGVDGSSPSEGSFSKDEAAANRRIFVAAADTVEHLLRREVLHRRRGLLRRVEVALRLDHRRWRSPRLRSS